MESSTAFGEPNLEYAFMSHQDLIRVVCCLCEFQMFSVLFFRSGPILEVLAYQP